MRRIALQSLFVATALLAVASTLSYGKVIYVDDDTVADFDTIQAAIDASVDGDVVLVAPGTYTGDGNRDIDFKGKAITVRSENGPRTCIIDSEGSEADPHRGFYFQNKEGGDSVLDGFTITGGEPGRGIPGGGGGVFCDRSSPSIRNCVIVGNVARGGAGVILSRSDAVISNCVIAGNQVYSAGSGGGLSYGRGYPVVRNCTIYGNRATYGGGVYCSHIGTMLFVNCILVGNESARNGTQLYSAGCTMIFGCPDIEMDNCCIEDDPNAIFVENWSDPHQVPDGCIRDDPVFVRPGYWDPNGTPDYPHDDIWVDGDYHLQSQAGRWDSNSASWVVDEMTSPCIDGGDPNSPIVYVPFPNGGAINIGAYGGTIEASKSYFDAPPCETIIAGDCKVDFEDLAILTRNWLAGNERER